jgi:hypothetical protein
MPIILPNQESEIRRIVVKPVQTNSLGDPLSKKHPSPKILVEWFKV